LNIIGPSIFVPYKSCKVCPTELRVICPDNSFQVLSERITTCLEEFGKTTHHFIIKNSSVSVGLITNLHETMKLTQHFKSNSKDQRLAMQRNIFPQSALKFGSRKKKEKPK